jgi:hypothetical protein
MPETAARMARDILRRIVELLESFQERYGSAHILFSSRGLIRCHVDDHECGTKFQRACLEKQLRILEYRLPQPRSLDNVAH